MTTGTLTVTDVFTRVQRTFGDEASVQVTEQDIIRWINDAQRDAVMQTDGLLQKVGFINSVVGQEEYNMPSDLFVLNHVFYKLNADASYYHLKWASLKEMTEHMDGWDGLADSSFPQYFTKMDDGKIIVFPTPDTSITSGFKLVYSRYATDVVDSTSSIDLPVYYHQYVVSYCMMQAYELDEDWDSAREKGNQVQSDLDFNNNRNFWTGRDSYPIVSVTAEDAN